MNHLELKHLRMIRLITETGNMTKAAEKLFISQSALSQQLKDIERKLQVNLFFRTPKKMIITATGKKLLRTAEKVIELVEDTELDIAKMVSGDRGELKVGTQCMFCYKWLPHVMSRFHSRFPNVQFEIGSSINFMEDLESSKYDVIITGTAEGNDIFDCRPLFKDQLVCIMSPDHVFTGQSYVHLRDFSRDNLISHSDKENNKLYQLLLKPRNIEPKRFMHVGQPQAIVELVASGFGVSMFPGWAVGSSIEMKKIKALPITKNGIPLTWNAVYLKNTNPPVFQEEFINMVSTLNFSDHSSAMHE